MTNLKSFTFAPAPVLRRSPEQHRRAKLIEKLLEQKLLALDPAYNRNVMRWSEQDGKRVRMPHRVNVKPWWGKDQAGRTVLVPKFGLRPIEFERGKSGVVVGEEAQLVSIIDKLIEATESGALDQLLNRPTAKNSKS